MAIGGEVALDGSALLIASCKLPSVAFQLVLRKAGTAAIIEKLNNVSFVDVLLD